MAISAAITGASRRDRETGDRRPIVRRPRQPHDVPGVPELVLAHQHLDDLSLSRTALQFSGEHVLDGGVLERQVGIRPRHETRKMPTGISQTLRLQAQSETRPLHSV